MIRLHGAGPNRYYSCPECGAVKEDVYRGGAIAEHRRHDAPDGTPPEAVREETLEILAAPDGEQLGWNSEQGVRSPPGRRNARELGIGNGGRRCLA